MKKQILIYRYNSICEPAVIEGFRQNQCEVDEITAEITQKNTTAAQCLKLVSDKLAAKKYDAVFSINFYPVISEVCQIYRIPYVCWTVDCPILELYSYSIKNTCNRIFLFDYTQYLEFHPKNPNGIFYLPLAADTDQFDRVINSITAADDCFKSEVSFVGSLYSEKCSYNKVKNLPDYLRGYFNGIMESQLKVYGYNFLPEVLTPELVSQYKRYDNFYTFPEKAEHNDVSAMAHAVLGYKLAELERKKLLHALSKQFTVDLYTGSDTSDLPSIHAKSRVKTLTEMPKVFHLSKINLNFTIKPIASGLPLRIWDILGCGGFLLTNFQTEIPDYFEIGKDLETFGSQDELIQKVDYYLNHEEERKSIAENGYKKVREMHRWKHRISQILTTL